MGAVDRPSGCGFAVENSPPLESTPTETPPLPFASPLEVEVVVSDGQGPDLPASGVTSPEEMMSPAAGDDEATCAAEPLSLCACTTIISASLNAE